MVFFYICCFFHCVLYFVSLYCFVVFMYYVCIVCVFTLNKLLITKKRCRHEKNSITLKLSDSAGTYNGVVGFKYHEGAWKTQSDSSGLPTLVTETAPAFYTHMTMNAETGADKPEQNGVSHNALCQVPSAICKYD